MVPIVATLLMFLFNRFWILNEVNLSDSELSTVVTIGAMGGLVGGILIMLPQAAIDL